MKNFDEFYPTPDSLLDIATKGCDFRKINTILEPSAGKGDIVEYLQRKGKENYKEYDIDCIEAEPELRMILEGKGMRVIHDNFLTYRGYKKYDLILMNPPFSNGEQHLLKALSLQEDGGNIICILNAESIRNPYSVSRKRLLNKLERFHAEITFHKEMFKDAERRTMVDVAVIRVYIPERPQHSFIFEELRAAKLHERTSEKNMTDLAVNDYLEAVIKQYEIEIEACMRLIREYNGMKPYILDDVKENAHTKPILELVSSGTPVGENAENTVLERIRMKYWKALFEDERFICNMTTNQLDEYRYKTDKLKDYDFSYYNIKTIQERIAKDLSRGVEECIIGLFDELSYEHSYLPETGKNIHYYDGWVTNKAHIVNRKVIIPMFGIYSALLKKYWYQREFVEKLQDIEKAFCYLDGKRADNSLAEILMESEKIQQTKNIECRYFTVTFYKKGTCHITFKSEELLKKFNIYGSQKKGWLPPCYGKKHYQDMTAEEKQVVDSFEGKTAYENMMLNPENYLVETSNIIPQLTTAIKKGE